MVTLTVKNENTGALFTERLSEDRVVARLCWYALRSRSAKTRGGKGWTVTVQDQQ